MGIFKELEQTVEKMRDDAATIEQWEGQEAGSRLRALANRLEKRIEEIRTRELTPEEAAQECSWSAHTVSRRIGDGTLLPGPSSTKGDRRVRRCDLYAVVHREEDPREPTGEPQVRELEGPDVAGEILSAAEA